MVIISNEANKLISEILSFAEKNNKNQNSLKGTFHNIIRECIILNFDFQI